jgi:hypothetical protein
MLHTKIQIKKEFVHLPFHSLWLENVSHSVCHLTILFKIRPYLAGFLLLSLMLSTGLRAAHSLFLHECHNHERLHCSTETEGKGSHIHDERFAPSDCSLCEFVFQAYSFRPSFVHTIPCQAIPETIIQPIHEAPALCHAAIDAAPSRGPPSL